MRLFANIRSIVLDTIAFARNLCRSRSALATENLFLRKQLTFFVEREQAVWSKYSNAQRVSIQALALDRQTKPLGVDLIFTMVSTTYRHTIAGM